MRISIVVSDKTVCKNGLCIVNIDLQNVPNNVRALQWYDNRGELEFYNGDPNQEITELPDWVNDAITAWDAANAYLSEQKQNSPEFSVREKNKLAALGFLGVTDWAVIPSVSDPTQSNPYLTNVQEFLNFRNTIRIVAIDPPETPFDFPEIPKAIWSNQ